MSPPPPHTHTQPTEDYGDCTARCYCTSSTAACVTQNSIASIAPVNGTRLRSCEVSVECGSEDALVAAEEIEIGTYRLRLETPLACTEAHLAEAERGLEALSLVRPSARGGLRPEEEEEEEEALSSSGRVESCGKAGAGVCAKGEL